jgi:hypothetical protein
MGYEISLPSGAKLKVNEAPFSEANRLLKVCANELAEIKLGGPWQNDLDLIKDLLCMAVGSTRIEAAAWPCMRRCLYTGVKIDDGTFEAEDARQDYLPVLAEMIKANVLPFTKGLSWKWVKDTAMMLRNIQKSPNTTTETETTTE